MNRWTRWTLAALIAGIVAPLVAWGPARQAVAAETNLFTNGDFESGTAGWQLFDVVKQTKLSVDKKVKSGGKAGLRIDRASDRGACYVKQFADLPTDQGQLTIKLRYRVDKGARLTVTLFFTVPNAEKGADHSTQVVSSGKTKRFEKVAEKVPIPAGATRVGMDLSMSTGGTAWIDDVEVLCDVPEGLADPGCETGSSGWRSIQPGSGTGALFIDKKRKAEGKASLRIERTSPRRYPEDGAFADARGDYSKKKKATLAVKVWRDPEAVAAIVLQAFAASGECLASRRVEVGGGERAFVNAKTQIELPSGVAWLRVALLTAHAGRVWFDEVRLEVR